MKQIENSPKRTAIKSGVLNGLISDSDEISSRSSAKSAAGSERFTQNAKLLDELTRKVPPSPINGYASLVNFAPSSGNPVHRWFWYREGYSQELVDEFIQNLPKGTVVLDPFCGAGTSLIAGQRRGLPSIGFDVNPISILVSRVKLTHLSPHFLSEIQTIADSLRDVTREHEADRKPALKIVDKVFEREVLHALLVFRRIIKAQPSPQVRDFLFVAWLSILEGVSNVYKEGNGIKYKNRKRTANGYIQVDLQAWENASLPGDRFAFVRNRLLEKIRLMMSDVKYIPARSPATTLIEDSAENISQHLQPNSVGLVIFSPPYCNCFNYFKMYKIELWMGEFVTTYDEMKSLNRRGLRSHVETVLKRTSDTAEQTSEAFAKLLDGIALWDKRIPNAVRGYFIDMRNVLKQIHAALKPSARCVMVVGNSAYGGIVIPTDAVLASIAADLGFTVEKLAVARSLTTSSQQREHLTGREQYLRESILVLSKKDPRLVDYDLKVTDEIPNADADRHDHVFLIRNGGLTAGSHKFHRYPAKFIPHIPRWALTRYGKSGAVVVDPFCGSGTTLVEATRMGMRAFGVDVDPIARLVSRVKTTPIPASTLEVLVNDVERKIARKRKANFKPDLPTLAHWFTPYAIAKLGVIRDVIEGYKSNPKIYRFLMVCFIAIIRKASNADDQTQKTYVSHTKIKVPIDATELFLCTLNDYATRLSALQRTFPVRILEKCSALDFADRWISRDMPLIDAIVTSPPYLNSVDYVYNQMTEYFWIGDLFGMQSQENQNAHKRQYVGTTRVSSSEYAKTFSTKIDEIDEVVERVGKKSKKNAYIVAKYFLDMRQHLSQAAKVLQPTGAYVMVVGDSLLSGEPIPVSQLMCAVAASEGFVLKGRFGYEIRNRHMRFPRMGRGGILRYDWVLELGREL